MVAAVAAVACSDDTAAPPASSTTTITSTTTASTAPTTTAPPTTSTPPAEPVPDDEWDTRSPADAGLSETGLAALEDFNVDIGSHCFVIVQDGELVVERYWNGTDSDTDTQLFSTTKSVAAVLVGIAADLGHLSLDQAASDFITEWQGTDSEDVTIRHLLRNTSGRRYDFAQDFDDLIRAEDHSDFSVALDQTAPPDTVWFYSNSAIQTLEVILERATDTDVAEFAEEHLFSPLGMTATLSRDAAGNVTLYSGLEAGCLDMARFMLMIQRGGAWGEDQIVSDTFVEEAIAAATDLNRAYGLLFWRNADPPWDHTDPRRDRTARFWPQAPLDAYMASGLGDQVSMVLPSHDTLFVRVGPIGASSTHDGVVADELAGLVVAALDG